MEKESPYLLSKFNLKKCVYNPDAIDITPDGILAFQETNFDDVIMVMDAMTGQIIRRFSIPEEVYKLKITPDGKKIIHCDGKNHITIWDAVLDTIGYDDKDNVIPGKMIRDVGDSTSVYSIFSSSHDGTKFVGISPQHRLDIYDVETGLLLRTFDIGFDIVKCFALSADDNYIVICAKGGNAVIFDVDIGEKIGPMVHDQEICWIKATTSNSKFMTIAKSREIYLWDILENKFTYVGKMENDVSQLAHNGVIALCCDGTIFASASIGYKVTLNYINGESKWSTLRTSTEIVALISFNRDGKKLIVVDVTDIRIFDIESIQNGSHTSITHLLQSSENT